MPVYAISGFTLLYFGGAFLGAHEANQFLKRFTKRVRDGEIMRLNVSNLEAYMEGETLMLEPRERAIVERFQDECVHRRCFALLYLSPLLGVL